MSADNSNAQNAVREEEQSTEPGSDYAEFFGRQCTGIIDWTRLDPVLDERNQTLQEDYDDYWLSPEFEALAYASLLEGDAEYMRMREEMAEYDLPLEYGLDQLDIDEHSSDDEDGESLEDLSITACVFGG